jgi:hypothetical protein
MDTSWMEFTRELCFPFNLLQVSRSLDDGTADAHAQ